LFGERHGLSASLATVARLCLQLVPNAQHVLISLIEDPEEGGSNIHFSVRTYASVDAVVDAEDRLHRALFENVNRDKQQLFSIGYSFVR
jgi:hypothetical protein